LVQFTITTHQFLLVLKHCPHAFVKWKVLFGPTQLADNRTCGCWQVDLVDNSELSRDVKGTVFIVRRIGEIIFFGKADMLIVPAIAFGKAELMIVPALVRGKIGEHVEVVDGHGGDTFLGLEEQYANSCVNVQEG
jgi:hypothetical protein